MTKEAFATHLVRLTKSLWPFAYRLTKDRDDANDLLQDTFLKGYTNRDKFSEGTNLKAWMFTIMKNTFITNYQKMMKRNTLFDDSERLYFLNSMESSTQNIADNMFIRNDISQALKTLDDTYLSPFLLYFNGFKYHEIAESLNIPIGTVKNRIHMARKELKQKLPMYLNG